MRLTARTLNRTLLDRQGLLARANTPVTEVSRRLLGLQAQESMSPYVGLHARVDVLDPYDVSRALADRSLVRLLTMRGTIHLLVPQDALMLRPWTQPRMEQELRASANTRPALGLDRGDFAAAVDQALADGPLAQAALGEALGGRFPDVPAAALGQLARVACPLVQLPLRGAWKESGGVVYDRIDRWVGAPLIEPTADAVQDVVRRYLRAYGPATAADVTAWSGVTRLGPVLAGMDDLARHEDERGRALFDVPDGQIPGEDAPAPVRLLGTYDNVFLSHAGRDRVTTPEARGRWSGVNGGSGCTIFVDGWLSGLWKPRDGRVEVLELFRTLTRDERADLDQEIAGMETLLAR